MKAKSKATAKTESKAAVELTVPVALRASILALSKVEGQEVALATSKEQKTLKLSQDIANAFPTEARSDVQAALKPLFVTSYAKAGRDEAYAGQQLSRIMALAFPGGRKATPEQAEKCAAAVKIGIEKGTSILELYSLANGSKAFNKKGELVAVKTSSNSGAHNRKTPKETYEAAIEAALVAFCKTAKQPFAIAENCFYNVAAALEIKGAKEAAAA